MDWNKYIKFGDFTSKSGIKLKWKWEFDRLDEEFIDRTIIITSILSLAYPYDVVSIHTVHPFSLRKVCKAIYYPDTDVSEGFIEKDGKYVLYDDVVTTGKTMIKAIKKYKKKPERCICIVDRRPEVKSYIKQRAVQKLDIISIIGNVLRVNLF